jgi:aquaporin Z
VRDRELIDALIVEFIGPFALVFAGVGAIIATQGQNLVAIAFAHGLAIGLTITAAGHLSGGHFNPAVTIGFLLTRRIDPDRALAYIVAQILGALAAALVLTLTYRDLERNADGVNLGVPAVGANLTSGNALVMEIVLTFFLMFVIFGVAVDSRSTRFVPGLAIGLTITMDIFAGAAVSGAIMNPARYLGPAIVQAGDGNWEDAWIWIVGPIVGAAIAALLFNDVLMSKIRTAAPARPTAPGRAPARPADATPDAIGDPDRGTLTDTTPTPAEPSPRSQRRRQRR